MIKTNTQVKNLRIIVSGKVQGVFFRASTKAVADQIGIKGFVKNQKDGSVIIEAEGDEASLDLFLEWCGQGPEKANVTGVESEAGEVKHHRNFEVIKKNLLW